MHRQDRQQVEALIQGLAPGEIAELELPLRVVDGTDPPVVQDQVDAVASLLEGPAP
jgi:hypothetical protein